MMDEHEGKGGSYARDPRTGKLTLLHRTEEPAADATETPAEAAPKTKPTTEKE